MLLVPVGKLVLSVEKAFDSYTSNKLSKNVITLQSVMYESIKCHGCIDFKILHSQKHNNQPKHHPCFNIECEENVTSKVRTYSASQAGSSVD